MKKLIYPILLLLIAILPVAVTAGTVEPFIDLLAWHAHESGSNWATTLTFPGNTANFIPSYINFNTRMGVKAGLLYAPDGNFWDTKFYWTYFPTTSSQNIPAGSGLVSSSFFSGSPLITGNAFTGGSIKWQLDMNMFDLEASHHFNPTPTLTFTPKIGIKGGSINQDISSRWNGIVYTATESATNDFTGIGPSFGLDAKWNVYQQFSLIGNIATALMYGKWNDSDTFKRPSALFGIITPQTYSTSMTQSKLGTMMMDYYVGLEWVHQGNSRVTVQLGYEMQYWANQLRLIAIQQLPTFGDLTIEGATCGVSIEL